MYLLFVCIYKMYKKTANKSCFLKMVAVCVLMWHSTQQLYNGIKRAKHRAVNRNLSFQKVMPLSHEPLHSLRVDRIGPVAVLFEMRTDDHSICIKVVFNVVIGHSRAYQHWDSHSLGNLCKGKKETEEQQKLQFLKIHTAHSNTNA